MRCDRDGKPRVIRPGAARKHYGIVFGSGTTDYHFRFGLKLRDPAGFG